MGGTGAAWVPEWARGWDESSAGYQDAHTGGTGAAWAGAAQGAGMGTWPAEEGHGSQRTRGD